MERRHSSNETTALTTDSGDVKSTVGAEFEVFLNFRGPDTRQNFADCLYHSMDGAGIRVFRDEEEIKRGETIGGELKRVIKSSTICMPIFSRNYAFSAWCLRELAYMVDCSRSRDGKVKILPIFFDVDPDDVKLKTGLYLDALHKHEQKFGCDVVQQWKEALREVAHIKGWDLKDKGDLGREIVRQEDIRAPGKRSRLWCPKIALDVVQTRKGTESIIALKLTGLSKDHNFTREEFSRLPNLRFLELEGGNLAGDFKNLLSSLRWLSWRRCPSNLQVVNLYLWNLVVLKLLDSDIPENWNGWSPCLANHNLKVIHLIRCHLSTFPDFSTCLDLKILVVNEHCPKSLQSGSSISKLEHLRRLEIIADQVQLSKLSASLDFDMFFVPFAICGLKRLSSLKLEGQCIQGLHSSIGEIVGLTSLSLKGCHRLRKLPDSIGKLRSLLILNLFDTGITELPDSIGDLKKLEKMNLGFTKIMELRNSIGGLESLLELHLRGTEITELPASIGFLKRLECLVLAESKIRELPKAIGMMNNLKVLKAGSCRNLEGEIPSEIGQVSFLEELDLSGSKVSRVPTTINQLSHLRELRLGDNRKLEKLPELPATLKHLYFVAETVLGNLGQTSSKWMGESPKGEEWSLSTDITWPPQLWSLRISCDDPRSLTRLPFSLCRLELGDVKSPIEQPFFSNLRYLRYLSELTLFRCWSREIEFELLASLQNLTVAECELLVRLSGLSSLGKLKELKVWNCSQLVEIQDLGEVKLLMELLIKSCSTIKMLPDLSKLRKLQILRLFHCESLQGLPDIPKTCHPYVHRCPMLGESVDNYKACEECRNSDMDVDGA